MATLKEYFEIDFPDTFKIYGDINEILPELQTKVIGICHLDFFSNSSYHSFFFESKELDINFFIKFLSDFYTKVGNSWICSNKLQAPSAKPGMGITVNNVNPLEVIMTYLDCTPMHISELRFTGRIFLYYDNNLSKSDIQKLNSYAASSGYHIQFRTSEYKETRMISEKPFAFICHDSSDKDLIAGPIAHGLTRLGCPVWYDEYSLRVGSNLRESIEKGLKECKKCVLILSPNFMNNKGWTKTEFNSVFTRQILEEQTIILPVWNNVNVKDVYEYSPSLANILGINWSIGEAEVVSKLRRAIEKLPEHNFSVE